VGRGRFKLWELLKRLEAKNGKSIYGKKLCSQSKGSYTRPLVKVRVDFICTDNGYAVYLGNGGG